MKKVMSYAKEFFHRADIFLLVMGLICAIFGIVVISSATASYHSAKYVIVQSASLILGVIAFVVIVGAIINAGYNGLSFIEPLGAGSSILDFADFISNSVLMPIVALLTCVFVGWIVKPKTIIDEVRISSKFSAAGAWTIMIKYIAPVLVIIILVAYVAAQFGFFSM